MEGMSALLGREWKCVHGCLGVTERVRIRLASWNRTVVKLSTSNERVEGDLTLHLDKQCHIGVPPDSEIRSKIPYGKSSKKHSGFGND